MNLTEYTEIFADGSEVVYVRIDRGNNEFTSMPKAVWDELEAAKENGTIS
jgi:hypothetical protein